MRKQHAEHNEKLCHILIAHTGFNDWVVTTAFYSSIHFVEHKLFPLQEGGITYANFNDYFSKTIVAKGKGLNKHTVKKILVKKYLKPVNGQYKRLFDACMNARYSNYMVSDPVANLASKDLSDVKAACI